MNAGMIHHEYGLTRSPWYSIGAYSLATATAILRILNNKHYLHDVVLGAGIGILSTELGYMFSDMLFREKGILLPNKNYGEIDISRQGSYLGLSLVHYRFRAGIFNCFHQVIKGRSKIFFRLR